ncbi:MAG TPA: hypothetical protein VHH72_02240 [Solirubrobacterales bacterium]|jgi:hypothetical protein|nr:hypothetical protein [Solirubrobacterales bacterium]
MHDQVLGLRAVALAAAVVALVGLGTAGLASGKKKHKPLKVSCEQLYAEIDKTGAQLQAKYNAIGFTIGLPDPAYPGDPPVDGFRSGQACKKQGKRIREGVGYMADIPSEGGPGFPGETNPAIREYFWTWSQTVTRTKKGRLRSAILNLKCEKYSYDGSPGNPGNVQTFPC